MQNAKFMVLKGIEVDIKADGSLDLDKKVLEKLDVVVGAVHSKFNMSEDEMTNRLIKAIESGIVNIIAHPTGRLLGRRDPYEIDLDKVFEAAKDTKTVMEVNADPYRMDLKDSHARAAIKAGVKLVISTDSHSAEQMSFMKLGIGIARRGWAAKDDIINTRSLKDMLRMLKH